MLLLTPLLAQLLAIAFGTQIVPFLISIEIAAINTHQRIGYPEPRWLMLLRHVGVVRVTGVHRGRMVIMGDDHFLFLHETADSIRSTIFDVSFVDNLVH